MPKEATGSGQVPSGESRVTFQQVWQQCNGYRHLDRRGSRGDWKKEEDGSCKQKVQGGKNVWGRMFGEAGEQKLIRAAHNMYVRTSTALARLRNSMVMQAASCGGPNIA